MADVLRWIVFLAGLAFFALAALSNFALLLAWIWRKKRSSLIPVVGGIAGMVGLLAAPFPELRRWWWVPPFVDPGTLPLVVPTVAWTIYAKFANRRRRGPRG